MKRRNEKKKIDTEDSTSDSTKSSTKTNNSIISFKLSLLFLFITIILSYFFYSHGSIQNNVI